MWEWTRQRLQQNSPGSDLPTQLLAAPSRRYGTAHEWVSQTILPPGDGVAWPDWMLAAGVAGLLGPGPVQFSLGGRCPWVGAGAAGRTAGPGRCARSLSPGAPDNPVARRA